MHIVEVSLPSTLEFKQLFSGDTDVHQMAYGSLDASIASAAPAQIKVKQGGKRNVEPLQQAPKVLHVPSAERDDRDEGWIEQKSFSFSKPWQHDPLRVALDQDDETREVQFGERQHGTPHEFHGFFIVFRKLHRLDA